MAVDKGTIFVTGANGGLGSAIVEQIASKAELSAFYGLYTVRNTTHAAALASALAHGPTHRVTLKPLYATACSTLSSPTCI
jgi:NAD(P)-dependent dehydrogenase (short-subunit alcohol dehydrogenase family)